ncbi:hypothetical protein LCM4576_33115 [Mesorhizobium sp. LCM 4576]|nr:hypothetical protein LCM4576_33115 [Mesorhizobium sp. LCM 4576]
MTLWKTYAFQRRAYQPSFSTAAERSSTGKLVTSFHSIGSRPGGGFSSRALMVDALVVETGVHPRCVPDRGDDVAGSWPRSTGRQSLVA